MKTVSEAEAEGYCLACEDRTEDRVICVQLDGEAECPYLVRLEKEEEEVKEVVIEEKEETIGERFARSRKNKLCIWCGEPSEFFQCKKCSEKVKMFKGMERRWEEIESNSTERD